MFCFVFVHFEVEGRSLDNEVQDAKSNVVAKPKQNPIIVPNIVLFISVFIILQPQPEKLHFNKKVPPHPDNNNEPSKVPQVKAPPKNEPLQPISIDLKRKR
jgi:hypothetical protein